MAHDEAPRALRECGTRRDRQRRRNRQQQLAATDGGEKELLPRPTAGWCVAAWPCGVPGRAERAGPGGAGGCFTVLYNGCPPPGKKSFSSISFFASFDRPANKRKARGGALGRGICLAHSRCVFSPGLPLPPLLSSDNLSQLLVFAAYLPVAAPSSSCSLLPPAACCRCALSACLLAPLLALISPTGTIVHGAPPPVGTFLMRDGDFQLISSMTMAFPMVKMMPRSFQVRRTVWPSAFRQTGRPTARPSRRFTLFRRHHEWECVMTGSGTKNTSLHWLFLNRFSASFRAE